MPQAATRSMSGGGVLLRKIQTSWRVVEWRGADLGCYDK